MNGLAMSSCLAQSYILYKYMSNTSKKSGGNPPKLIMGYIVNNQSKVYYGHFWVEWNGVIHDIATDTYLIDYDTSLHSEIKRNMRILTKEKPSDKEYTNIDNTSFELTRTASYIMCMNDRFLEDVKNNAPNEIYIKIKSIYNQLIK